MAALRAAAAALYPLSRLVRSPRGGLWEVMVGLEVHAQVSTRSKLFSGAPAGAKPSTPPNSLVSLVDAAHPGTLPRPNAACVDALVRTGMALRAELHEVSFWERKHYFYADLPAGFQITQLAAPTVGAGALTFEVPLRERVVEAAGKLAEGAGLNNSNPTSGALGAAGSGASGVPPSSRKQRAKAAAEAVAAAATAASTASTSGGAAGAASSAALSALEAVAASLTAAAAATGKAAAKGKRQSAGAVAGSDDSIMMIDAADDGFEVDDTGSAAAVSVASRAASAGVDHSPAASWVLNTGKRSRETVPVTARIERLQLEQDSGKSVHGLLAAGAAASGGGRGDSSAGAAAAAAAPTLPLDGSCVDLNRAGTALLEIVTAPDFRSADEAGAFLRALLALLKSLGVSDAAIEEGNVRCDVNVSVRPVTRREAADVGERIRAALASDGSAASAAGSSSTVAGTAVGSTSSASGGATVGALAVSEDLSYTRVVSGAAGGLWRPVPSPSAPLASAAGSGFYPAPNDGGMPLLRQPSFPRVELKNVASLRGVERAIESEVARQIAILEGSPSASGAPLPHAITDGDDAPLAPITGSIDRETRSFDVASGVSARMRGKEGAQDYRFLPEPDMLPVVLSGDYLQAVADSMPVLPATVAKRLQAEHGLSRYDAHVLVASGFADAVPFYTRSVAAALAQLPEVAASITSLAPGATALTADALEGLLSVTARRYAPGGAAGAARPALPPPAEEVCKAVVNWMTGDLFGRLHEVSGVLAVDTLAPPPAAAAAAAAATAASAAAATAAASVEHRLDADRLGELVALVHSGRISGKAGKETLDAMMGVQQQAPTAARPATADAAGAAAAPLPDARSPLAIATARGLLQVNDRDAILALARAAVADPANAGSLAKYRAGHDRVLGVFVGLVLKASGGAANPAIVSEAVREVLGPCPPRGAGKV